MLMRAIATLTLLLALVAPASAQVGPPGLRYEATPNTAATSGVNIFTPLQVYSGITTLEATISLVSTGSVISLVTITNGVTVVTTLNGGTALTASVETVLSWRASASSTYSLRCETTTSLGKLYVVEIRSAIAKAGGSSGGSGGVASLTPWTSTIDAAGHDLIGAGNITGTIYSSGYQTITSNGLQINDNSLGNFLSIIDNSGVAQLGGNTSNSVALLNGTNAGVYTGKSRTLTNNTATTVFACNLSGTDTAGGFTIVADVQSVDASHHVQSVHQEIHFTAVNQNGTLTTQAPQYPAGGVGNAQVIPTGTLTVDWTATVSSTTVSVKATAASSLTSPTVTCRYSVVDCSPSVITPQ